MVEGDGLENRYSGLNRDRGFESRPLRHELEEARGSSLWKRLILYW